MGTLPDPLLMKRTHPYSGVYESGDMQRRGILTFEMLITAILAVDGANTTSVSWSEGADMCEIRSAVGQNLPTKWCYETCRPGRS